MFDVQHQAENVRRRVLQPLADALVARTGVNCFQAAAAMVVTYVGLGVASNVRQAVVGPWTWWNLALGMPLLCAFHAQVRHLLDFQAKAPGQDFRIVHPVYRSLEVSFHMVTCFLPLATACNVSIDLFRHHDLVHASWALVDSGGMLLMSVGCQVAACEWRRLPRTRPQREIGFAGAEPEMT